MTYLHLPLPSEAAADIFGYDKPAICMVFKLAEVEWAPRFFQTLRALRHEPQTRRWRIDERLLSAARRSVGEIVEDALAELSRGSPESMKELLVECPTCLTVFPEIGEALADLIAHRKPDLFAQLGGELGRIRKASPGERARELSDQAFAIREEARLGGRKIEKKEVLIALHPGATLSKAEQATIANAVKSGSKGIAVNFQGMACPHHAGMAGLYGGPGLDDLQRAQTVVNVARDVDMVAAVFTEQGNLPTADNK